MSDVGRPDRGPDTAHDLRPELRKTLQAATGAPPASREAPPDVADVTARDWKVAISYVRRHMVRDRVSVAAGAFAYRWFLSLFPAVIALLAVTSLLAVPRSVTVKLVHGVSTALPAGASGVLNDAITAATQRTRGSLVALIVAGAVALWSAVSGMVMLEEGLDMVYEVTEDRTFLGKRVLALPLLVGAALLGGAASGLAVFGPQIGNAIKSAAPVGGGAFSALWTILRWLVALMLIHMLLSFIYWLAPNTRTSWRWFSPGAATGTVLWAAISLGFSFYTTSFGSYGETYGAFAGVAILIFWLFLTGMAVLLGGEVNAAFEQQEASGTYRGRGRPEPDPDRLAEPAGRAQSP